MATSMKKLPSPTDFENSLKSKNWAGLTVACEIEGGDDPLWLYSINVYRGIRFFTNVAKVVLEGVNSRGRYDDIKANEILTVFLASLIAYDEMEDPRVRKVMSHTMTQFCLEFATTTEGWSAMNTFPSAHAKHIVIVDWESDDKAVCAAGTFHHKGFPGVDTIINKAVEIYTANMNEPPYEIPLN
mgnify:FL=1